MESKKRKVGTLADIDVAEKRLKILHADVLPPVCLSPCGQSSPSLTNRHRLLT